MAASASDAHPFPIFGARYRFGPFPILDEDGDLVTGAAGLDTELSQDFGTFADATNEATEIGSAGMYYIDIIATELDNQTCSGIVKTSTTGAKTTPFTLYPVRLPVIATGTAQAGGASSITLASGASAITDYYVGCYVNPTNNSPSNVLGQARMITAYNGSTKVATVEGTYGTNPSSATTYEILATEIWIFSRADVNAWLGTVVATPATAGIPDVNAKNWNNLTTVALPLVPTTAGRTLDVSTGGEAGVDLANVGSPTTTLNLSGTTVKTATDVETDTADIQGRLPAALVSGRIDASVGAMASGVLTATAIAADAITDAKVASDVTIASVTGAVGSVTGNVGGSVASVASGGITAASFAADAITAAKIAADVTTELQSGLATASALATVSSKIDTVDDFVDTEVAAIKTVVDAIQVVTDKLSDTLEDSGGGAWIFTEPALAQAPSGTGASAASIVQAMFTTDTGETEADAVAGSVVYEIVQNVSGGGGGLDAAGVRAAIGLSSANLDTQLSTIDTVVDAILVDTGTTLDARIPAALVSGRMDASVGAMAANVLTATAINADAITAAKVAADVTTELQSGLATAANLATVAGYIDTEVAAVKAVTDLLPNGGALSSLATAAALATVSGKIDTVDDFLDTEIAAIKAVTDALPNAGALTSLATASALATVSGKIDTVDDFLDTEIAAIKAKTDNLPSDPADASDIAAAFAVTNGKIDVVDDLLDSEVGAIKTVVDAIEVDTQDIQGRLPTALVSGRMPSDAVALSGSTTAADRLEAHLAAVLQVVIGTGSTTTALVLNPTTGINGAAPSSTNDTYNGRVVVFTSGTLAGQATSVSDYVGSTSTLTVVALTGAATAGDTAVIV